MPLRISTEPDDQQVGVPRRYTDRKTDAAKALAARLNRRNTVSVIRNKDHGSTIVARPSVDDIVLLTESGRSRSEARLKLGDYDDHPIELLPLVLLLSHFGWDIRASSLRESVGSILFVADDDRDQRDLLSVVADNSEGGLSLQFRPHGAKHHDFQLVITAGGKRITTLAVMALVKRLQKDISHSLIDWLDAM